MLLSCHLHSQDLLVHFRWSKSKDLPLTFFSEAPAARRNVAKTGGGPWKEPLSCRCGLGVTEESLIILRRFWALEVLTTKQQKHFCSDKAFSHGRNRDCSVQLSLYSYTVAAAVVGKGIRQDDRGEKGKRERTELILTRARPEVAIHLSLTVFQCLLVTLSEFLQKQNCFQNITPLPS